MMASCSLPDLPAKWCVRLRPALVNCGADNQ
jgi:hypothetical protein